MQTYFTEIGHCVLNKANRPGVVAEIFLAKETKLNFELYELQIESLTQAEDIGVGLRLLQDGRIGFSYSNDLSPQGLDCLVANAQTALKYAKPNPHADFPRPALSYPELSLIDRAISGTNLEQKVELLIQAETAALELGGEMEKIETAGYIEQHSERMILNSQALTAYEESNGCGIYLSALARTKGKRSRGSSSLFRKRLHELEAKKVGEEAGQRALRDLHAKFMPSGSTSCIFEPRIAAKFLGFLSGAFSLEQVQKGKSLLQNQMERSIAPAWFTLHDDSQDMRGTACTAFDGEGSPTQKTRLVYQGVLCSYLCDTVWGGAAGCPSTGNSYRSLYSSLPGIGINQLILSPGETKLQAMISGIDDGLLVTEIMGMHTANVITGEFSLGAAGIRIESGKLTHGVRGVTIACKLMDLLQNIEAVGDDLDFFGKIGAPSWMIRRISVAGE